MLGTSVVNQAGPDKATRAWRGLRRWKSLARTLKRQTAYEFPAWQSHARLRRVCRRSSARILFHACRRGQGSGFLQSLLDSHVAAGFAFLLTGKPAGPGRPHFINPCSPLMRSVMSRSFLCAASCPVRYLERPSAVFCRDISMTTSSTSWMAFVLPASRNPWS